MATLASNRAVAWDSLLTAAHAWQFRPGQPREPSRRDRWLSLLPADERARYEGFRSEKMREQYLAARVVCRTTLSRYTGVDPSQWRFGEGPYGKPTIIEPDRFRPLRFNMTHTDDLTVCAVTRAGEVGVDAEEMSSTPEVSLLARHFLSRHAQEQLARLPLRERAARFFEQWVLKEAYVKANGEGLAFASERLTVEQNENGEPISIGRWQFSVHRPTPKHVAAAAVLRETCTAPVAIHWLLWN